MRRAAADGRNVKSVGVYWTGLATVLLGGVGMAGCDSGSFAPPPPPELAALPSARSAPRTTAIELIEAPGRNSERDTWLQAARIEAGLIKTILAVNVPPPPPVDPAAWQAATIRSAPGRGINAVIVEPIDSPEVVKALDEVRGQGTPVVLLGRGAAPSDPARPFHRVVFGPAELVVKTLIQAVQSQARSSSLKENGRALIVTSETGPFADELVALFESSLKAAGVREIAILDLKDETLNAEKRATARIAADPAITQVLTVGAVGTTVAVASHGALKAHRDFIIGGALTYESAGDPSNLLTHSAGLIDRKIPAFGRAAVRAAAALARGETVDLVVVIPIELDPSATVLGGSPRSSRPAGGAVKGP